MLARRPTSSRWVAIAALALVSGCLAASRDPFVRYDARSDTFHFLTVFTHIRGETAGDLEHLATLETLRPQLIFPVPEPGIFGEPAYVRQSDSEYLRIDLGQRAAEKLATRKTRVPLNSVSIKPGRFFVSKANTLCYYHQVSVPGKTLDAVLEELAKATADQVIDHVSEELKRRRNGGKTISWDDFRIKLLSDRAEKQPAAGAPEQAEQPTGPLAVLSEESLRLLLKQAAGGDLSFHRQGIRLETSLWLTQGDCQQARVLIDVLRDEAIRNLPKDPAARKPPNIQAERSASRGLVITVDIGPCLGIGGCVEPPLGPDAEDKRPAYVNTVASLRGRGVEVDKGLSFADILRGFAAGTL